MKGMSDMHAVSCLAEFYWVPTAISAKWFKSIQSGSNFDFFPWACVMNLMKVEHRSVIKFLTKEGKASKEIHERTVEIGHNVNVPDHRPEKSVV